MDENTLFWKMFGRRIVVCYILIALLFLSCIIRVTVICSKDYSAVAINQNYYKLKISDLRGTIYDKNMKPITNNVKKIFAAVTPTPRAITAISSVLSGEYLKNTLDSLKKGKPVICQVPKTISCDGIFCTEIYTTENNSAKHTVGLYDKQGKGIMGLQKAYETVLNQNKTASLLYECDGKGNILEGITPTLEYNTSVIADGIISTIDLNIQNIAEYYADYIEKGAIIIADAKTGKIRASVSRPDINVQDITVSLDDENSPFIDRSINAYNVGSVFKPCVAIAGIENGKNSFSYNCTGSCEIIDRVFRCHKEDGHGYVQLKKGIAHSCNTFFYNFAFNIGGDEIYKTASNLGFGRSITLCEGFETVNGNLPSKSSLNNPAHLANFSIGQGELMLSPISILTLYSAISNNGVYYTPSLVEGIIEEGNIQKNEIGSPTRVMKESTANILKEYLSEVLIDGTGIDAMPKTVTAAGKTATAQTGKYENGVEICSGWFCGFFPFENPEYVVVVFSENTNLQSKTCSQIFSGIADDVTSILNS